VGTVERREYRPDRKIIIWCEWKETDFLHPTVYVAKNRFQSNLSSTKKNAIVFYIIFSIWEEKRYHGELSEVETVSKHRKFVETISSQIILMFILWWEYIPRGKLKQFFFSVKDFLTVRWHLFSRTPRLSVSFGCIKLILQSHYFWKATHSRV
jgi:hypothetical protein